MEPSCQPAQVRLLHQAGAECSPNGRRETPALETSLDGSLVSTIYSSTILLPVSTTECTSRVDIVHSASTAQRSCIPRLAVDEDQP